MYPSVRHQERGRHHHSRCTMRAARFSELVCLAILVVLAATPIRAIPVRVDGGQGQDEPAVRELIVAIKSKAPRAALDEAFVAVSSNARKQYTLRQVCEDFGGAPGAVAAVKKWAERYGGDATATPCGDFVTVHMREDHVLKALSASRAIIPIELAPHVDFIDGFGGLASSLGRSLRRADRTRNFNPQARREAVDSALRLAQEKVSRVAGKNEPWYPDCMKMNVSPSCLREAYNVSAGKEARTSQGVALFGGQFYSRADLAQFWKQFKVPPQKVIDQNDNKENEVGNEATLDIQYITGVAAGSGGDPTSFIHYACTTADCKPFLTWIMQQASMESPPLVQSVSVGTTEHEYVEEMGLAYVKRINQEFQKAGLRGLSLLFATGDTASQRYKGKWWINFPAASPYVTAVGGVWLGELGDGPMGVDPDTTGGFANSEAHVQLDHQRIAVEGYLKEAAKTSAKQPKVFNSTLRAVPDLSAMSDAYVIVEHGHDTFIGGTSAATPVVAAMVSLLNDARISAGKQPLGFLNPFLYANPACFQDIVHGANAYEATQGWDPASGLGTPIFSCLRERALAAP